MTNSEKTFPFEITITPRLSETDLLGHINNTALGIWYEAGRTPVLDLMRETLIDFDQLMMAVRTEIDYIAELFYGTDVQLYTGFARIGISSVTYYQEAWQNGKKCGRASTTLVYVDNQSRRPKPVPDTVRKFINQRMVEADPGRPSR